MNRCRRGDDPDERRKDSVSESGPSPNLKSLDRAMGERVRFAICLRCTVVHADSRDFQSSRSSANVESTVTVLPASTKKRRA